MTAMFPGKRSRFFRTLVVCTLGVAAISFLLSDPRAQANKLVLISQETSTRAIAVDSVTQTREPFSPTTAIIWGNDNRTRVMLFAMGLNLQPNETAGDVTAEAEDGAHNFYSLPVEYVAPVANQEWINSIVVRLNEQMNDVGDVLVAIAYHGERSNRVRVG